MGVTPEDVRRIAELAALHLDDDEAERMRAGLDAILGHMEALAEVDTGDVKRHAAGGEAPLRPDSPGPDPLVEGPASAAPEWQDGFFTVPRLGSHDGGEGSDPGEPGGGG